MEGEGEGTVVEGFETPGIAEKYNGNLERTVGRVSEKNYGDYFEDKEELLEKIGRLERRRRRIGLFRR